MPIRLRFAVHGVRNHRILHLVAIDQRKRRNARPLELLGKYNPRVEENVERPVKRMDWAVDRIRHWLDHGALPSTAVERVLRMGGITKRTNEELAAYKAEVAKETARLEQERDAAIKAAKAARIKAKEDTETAAKAAAKQEEEAPRQYQPPHLPDEPFRRDFLAAIEDPLNIRKKNIRAAKFSQQPGFEDSADVDEQDADPLIEADLDDTAKSENAARLEEDPIQGDAETPGDVAEAVDLDSTSDVVDERR